MKLARTLVVSLMLALIMGSWTTWARGWSLLHPFTSDPPASQPAKAAPKPAGGTAAANNLGTLGGFTPQKSPAKKPVPNLNTTRVWSNSANKPASKPSFLSSLNPFHKDPPPKKPMTVQDFVGMERPK